MITLNGKQFAPVRTEAPSAAGFYKANRSSITLMNREGGKIGVINKHGCLCRADIMADGRTWYSFATIAEIGRYDSYLKSVDEPRAALREHCGIAA